MKKSTCEKVLKFLMSTYYEDEQVVEACDLLMNKVDELPEAEKASVSEGVYPLPGDLDSEVGFALYSDGACRGNPGPGAWGAMGQSSSGEVIFEASGVEMNTTNNRMELVGAIESLRSLSRYLEELGQEDVAPILYSDSKYVVDGIEKWVPGWKARGWKKADKKAPENLELWQEFDAIKDDFPGIVFRWVKGHAGHPQNERCDELANLALDDAGF